MRHRRNSLQHEDCSCTSLALLPCIFRFLARLCPRIVVNATGGNKDGQADYHATIVPPAQGWNTAEYATPPTEPGDEIEAASAAAEEEPLDLRVRYYSRPLPATSESENIGENGVCYTKVSNILPSDSYPAVMAKILHRLKEMDRTHSPHSFAPTVQIDYVDIQFGATAAQAPGFPWRRKIDYDNVGELLNYLRQRTAGDDILEVFLVPLNEQDAKEHVSKTCEDWTIERATEGKDVNLAELE